ncbi:MAG: DNA mismatch repair endonuclease MutL [candidate division Zixibacteria bacterium]|nr:DNA mismatch repair endonuclease MutL [candidate division Zixibacteria bacterium]
MNNEIILLPEDLVDKIAAGEVVERPASVVKELVENSIDAGAKNISVEIKKGGIKFIRVTDDGVGMDEKNSVLAFQRHATSKIKGVDDLFRITTLGFRGEALPSIASVCFLDLLTRSSESLSGTRVKIEGGIIKEKKQTGGAVGTSVVIREIFYNVPARRKFLKMVLTETRHIIDLLTRFAIAYPEISFKLKSDERELFSFPGGNDLTQRVADVFGKNQMEKMVEIKAGDAKPTVTGFVGKPEIARSNRAELYIFVNRRPIVSRSLYHAVQAGYGELLPKGKFPFAIIFIEIDPRQVDVNVHPTKSEVRFADERGVHDLVYAKIKESLTSPQIITDLRTTEKKEEPFQPDTSRKISYPYQKEKPYPQESQQTEPSAFSSQRVDDQESTQKSFFSEAGEKLAQGLTEERARVEKEKEIPEEKRVESGATNFWQLADTYIFSQVKGNLMVLDQHAAHERILYEEALRNLTQRQASSQQVLFPAVSELTPKEFQILEEHKELIGKLGFEIKHFGGRTILVTAVPTLIRNKSGEVFLKEILTQLEEEGKIEKDRVKAVAKSFACHGAIKAGERLAQEEMQNLLRQLFTANEPYSCPHGRPTVIKLSLEELNKKFGRS